MRAKDAYTLLETMLDGIDPITGEVLPDGHLCQEPAVMRALHRALTALQNDDEEGAADGANDAAFVNKNGRLNAGRPWTEKDLDCLKQLHEAGTSMDEMCHKLQRRKRGIEKQLVYLGLVDEIPKKPSASDKYPRAGMPWTAEDDKTLWDLWKNGAPEENISKLLRRTPYAIRCRMERLGMLDPQDEQPLLPPWSLEDVQTMKRLHAEGRTPEEIAAQMCQPAESVRARMFYMGLTKDAPIHILPKK